MASLQQLRDKLQNNRWLGVGLAGGLFASAVILALWLMPGQQGVRGDDYLVWAFNPQTGKPELRRVSETSPDTLFAHVFACGSCDDANARFVGFVSQNEGAQVRMVEGEQYHHPMSEQGRAITAIPKQRCQEKGKALQPCHPLEKYR